MYNVVLTNRAVKNFKKLPEELQNKCGEIFDDLEYSFAPIRLNVKKLKGYENTYRIRIGSWRIIYKVDNNIKSIVIYDILPRKSAY
ncbi:MAG: type II toxin-antitoxin system RelE/ParE family toxin [Methanosarcinales archaeon]|nr:type II toxin-antitoxin system RelE/ParE family toxin [Methanosarcinales archaeon]